MPRIDVETLYLRSKVLYLETSLKKLEGEKLKEERKLRRMLQSRSVGSSK